MYTTYNMVKLYHTEIQLQYINTLINIKYVHYIQHGEVIHTEIQLYNT